MGILLAGANFDLFLDKVESGQHLADAGDAENPLYRFDTPVCQVRFLLTSTVVYNTIRY